MIKGPPSAAARIIDELDDDEPLTARLGHSHRRVMSDE